jgi:hypothetical protein
MREDGTPVQPWWVLLPLGVAFYGTSIAGIVIWLQGHARWPRAFSLLLVYIPLVTLLGGSWVFTRLVLAKLRDGRGR